MDKAILLQRHREAVVHIAAHDKAVDVRCGSGALQGDSPSGRLFLEVYHPLLDNWLQLVSALPRERLCTIQDPFSGIFVDTSITTYADDMGKTTIAANRAEILQKLMLLNQWLDESLSTAGLAQNVDKQEHVFHASGTGSREALRQVYSTGIGIGKTCAVSKYLGGQRTYNNAVHQEVQQRVRAAYTGYSIMGNFWARIRHAKAALLLVFRCMVHEAMLSGLEALVLPKGSYKRLDKTILGLGRKLMQGRACEKIPAMDERGEPFTKFEAKPNSAVWRFLQLAPAHVEVRVRRLRFWQKVAERKEQHVALLATMFGRYPFEVAPYLHPWAKQLREDVQALAFTQLGAEVAQQMGQNPALLFRRPLCEHFVSIEVDQLRSQYLDGNGHQEGAEVVHKSEDEVPRYTCDVNLPDGQVCGQQFSSFRALQTHKRHAANHGFVAPEHYLAVTNQCPWCKVSYTSLAATKRHIKKALAAQHCRGEGSVVFPMVQTPDSLVCKKKRRRVRLASRFAKSHGVAFWWSCIHRLVELTVQSFMTRLPRAFVASDRCNL